MSSECGDDREYMCPDCGCRLSSHFESGCDGCGECAPEPAPQETNREDNQ